MEVFYQPRLPNFRMEFRDSLTLRHSVNRDIIFRFAPDGGKWTFSIITEKILKSIFSALYLSQHLLFSEVTQPFERNQKVNKDLTPSGHAIFKPVPGFYVFDTVTGILLYQKNSLTMYLEINL